MRGYDFSDASQRGLSPVRVMIGIAAIGACLSVGAFFMMPQAPVEKPAVAATKALPQAVPDLGEQELEMINARLPAQLGEGISLLSVEKGAAERGASYVARLQAPEASFDRARELLRSGLSERDLEACRTGAEIIGITGNQGGNATRVEAIDEEGEVYANMTWRNFICEI